MLLLSAFTRLLFILFLTDVCGAQNLNVTVRPDDKRLVWTNRGTVADHGIYDLDCGGIYSLNPLLNVVSLTFTGTAVTVNLLRFGGHGQISLDGVNLTVMDTSHGGVSNCSQMSWNSGTLSPENHTVAVTCLGTFHSSGPFENVVIENFIYMDSAGPSSSIVSSSPSTGVLPTTSPNTTGHKTKNIGVIAGATTGGIVVLLIVGIFSFRRRSRQQSIKPSAPTLGLLNDISNASEKLEAPSTVVGIPASDGPGSPDFYVGALHIGEHVRTGSIENTSVPTELTSSFNIISDPKQPSSALLPSTQQETSGSLSSQAASHASSPLSQLSQMPTLAPNPASPDTGLPIHHSTSSTNVPNIRQLSQAQLELVQRLSEQNVPGSALAIVIDSMASRTTPSPNS